MSDLKIAKQVGLRLSSEEVDRLRAVSDRLGLRPTEALRYLIKREFDAKVGAK